MGIDTAMNVLHTYLFSMEYGHDRNYTEYEKQQVKEAIRICIGILATEKARGQLKY